MIKFLHSNIPEAILLHIGPLQIHWYGLLMVVGGLLGFWLVLFLAKQYKQDKSFFSDLLLYWVIGAILGARVYYVLYAWDFYKDNLVDVLKIWQGGLAIHGIILGGFIATFIYCRIKKKDFWLTADIVAVGLVLTQIVGRVGNYFNQEIFGLPTSQAWGIPIEIMNRPVEYLQAEYFHPTFLYESLLNIFVLLVLLFLTSVQIKKHKWPAGTIFLSYLILYSVVRFSLEFLRIDYSPLVFGVRWAQIYSVLLGGGAIVFMFIRIVNRCRFQRK